MADKIEITLKDATRKNVAVLSNEDLFTYRDRMSAAISTLVDSREYTAADIIAQCREGVQEEIDHRGIRRGE